MPPRLTGSDVQGFGNQIGTTAISALRGLHEGEITRDQAVDRVLLEMGMAANTVAAVREQEMTPEETNARRLRSYPGYGELFDAGYYFDGNIGIADEWPQIMNLQMVDDRAHYLSHGFEAEMRMAYYPTTGKALPGFHGYFLRPIPSKMQPDKREAWMAEYVRKITSQGGTPIQFGIDNEG